MTSEKPLPRSLLVALRDCAQYVPHRPYIWKPQSMRKLEAKGLVRPEQVMFLSRVSYRITNLGRAYLEMHAND